jgi:hypothetical protein
VWWERKLGIGREGSGGCALALLRKLQVCNLVADRRQRHKCSGTNEVPISLSHPNQENLGLFEAILSENRHDR